MCPATFFDTGRPRMRCTPCDDPPSRQAAVMFQLASWASCVCERAACRSHTTQNPGRRSSAPRPLPATAAATRSVRTTVVSIVWVTPIWLVPRVELLFLRARDLQTPARRRLQLPQTRTGHSVKPPSSNSGHRPLPPPPPHRLFPSPPLTAPRVLCFLPRLSHAHHGECARERGSRG